MEYLMEVSTTRIAIPAGIVAGTQIVILIGTGAAYLRFAPGPETVSVPAGYAVEGNRTERSVLLRA
jgi:hypothetical protein